MSDRSLPRILSAFDGTLIVVGGVIGSGIFLVPSNIASLVGTPSLLLAVFVTGGVLTLAGALAYAEMGAALPGAGGLYVYLREAYGPRIGFLYGWALFLVIHSGSMATLAVAFSIYLGYFVPLGVLGGKAASVVCIFVLTVVNVLGLRVGAFVQNLFAILKVGGLLGLVGIALAGGAASTESAGVVIAPSGLGDLASGFGLAVVAALWAYEGWHLVTFSAGEFKNPQRNLPLALVAGSTIVVALYLIACLSYLRAFSIDRIAHSARLAADVAEASAGPWGASLVSAAIVVSIFGATNALLLTGPRVYYAMAQDGLFLPAAARIDPRFQTPAVAIVIQGIWAGALTLVGSFSSLFTYVVFTGWIFYGLGAFAVIRLRKLRPDLERPYRAWGYPWLPCLFVGSALLIVANTLVRSPKPSSAGLALVLVGFVVYRLWKRE